MSLTLNATLREGIRPDELRADGKIPAVVYAPDLESVSIAVEMRDFDKLYKEVGDSTIFELLVEGTKEPYMVLVQATQMDVVKDTVKHIDFYKITAGQELSVTIQLNFVADAPAVKAHGGTLQTQRDTIDATCLPKDLVDHIDVDLSSLTELTSSIHVGDLTIPAGITVTDVADLLVANIAAPKSQEEMEAADAADAVDAPSVEDIEVEEKGKGEEETEA